MTETKHAGGHASTFASGTPDRPYDEVDISSKAFWDGDMFEREKTFAKLREKNTITWHPPVEDQLMPHPEDYGFWAVTSYDHLVDVTKRHEDFLSGPGILLENLPADFIEGAQGMIGMDPPRHAKLRRLVASAFTPKQMKRIEDMIERNAKRAVAHLIEQARAGGGEAEFVEHCAGLMPMNNINDMLNVPAGKREEAQHHTAVAMSWNDPEVAGHTRDEVIGSLMESNAYCHDLATGLARERRQNPGNDLISALAQAEVDGEQLTDHEIGSFFVLLTVAGNDTTRQSTSHGLKALTDHPEQKAWLLEDLEARLPTAVEELVRWATPIMTFRRTAAHDCELAGQQVTKGDKVVMIYSSANADERRIPGAHELDLSRDPNPHITFGGGGIHHCLGNQLARRQLKAVFTELLTQVPHITAGEPVRTPGNFFNIVKSMPAYL